MATKETKDTNVSRKMRISPSAIFLFLLIVGMISVIIFNNVKLNELKCIENELKNELNVYQSESIKLDVEFEKRTNLIEIENKAYNELGLQKIDKSQIKYINIPNNDKIQSLQTDKKSFIKDIFKSFSIILEYLS